MKEKISYKINSTLNLTAILNDPQLTLYHHLHKNIMLKQ